MFVWYQICKNKSRKYIDVDPIGKNKSRES